MTVQATEFPFSTPERRKPLIVRRAERKARRAQTWGLRVEQAEADGASVVAEVQFDWARATFGRLDSAAQERAFRDLAAAIARVREEHAQ